MTLASAKKIGDSWEWHGATNPRESIPGEEGYSNHANSRKNAGRVGGVRFLLADRFGLLEGRCLLQFLAEHGRLSCNNQRHTLANGFRLSVFVIVVYPGITGTQLGGGFNYFLFSPLPGEMIQFD